MISILLLSGCYRQRKMIFFRGFGAGSKIGKRTRRINRFVKIKDNIPLSIRAISIQEPTTSICFMLVC